MKNNYRKFLRGIYTREILVPYFFEEFLLKSNNTYLQVSYVKGVDWYLMTSFLFIFLSLVECVLVERLANDKKKVEIKEEGIDNEGLVINKFPLVWIKTKAWKPFFFT